MVIAEFRVNADDEDTVLVEIDSDDDVEPIGISDVIQQAKTSFRDSISVLKPVTEAVVHEFREMGPEEVCVEFGFKMHLEKGIVIVKGGGEATFTVTLTWKQERGES